MFFTRYNPMTDAEVAAKLADKRQADGTVCDRLSGWSFKVHLEGDFAPSQLDYIIHDGVNLRFTENGITHNAPYRAVDIGHIVILTHLVPDSSRGWHLVIDTASRAVTAFETWFGITVPVGIDIMGGGEPTSHRDIPREIQRQYYFGWLDRGGEQRPEKPHTTTNRIEGRGLHWRYDNDYELLTFFPSIVCSTFVELSDPQGGITMTNPSDFIKIDDTYYIYARWDVEFSGRMWIEVIDLFRMTAAGIELGFNESDALIYASHTAYLEITGDAAHMEMISDYGDKKHPMPRLKSKGKGARYAYRPMDIDIPMTREEALRHASERQQIFEGTNVMSSANNLEPTEKLVGKHFILKLDGEYHAAAPWQGDKEPVYEYDIIDKNNLKWRFPGGTWQTERYVAFEPAQDLFMFSHMLTGDPYYANVTQAVDFSNGLVTTVRAKIGNWHSEWEVGAHAKFGVLEYPGIVPPFARRHHFTNDLVGKSIAWAYSDTMSSIHVYSSPESYSWTIFQDDNSGGATWSSPCFFIKLREEAYLFQWVEENCNGGQSIVIFNPRTLHDCGFYYGVNHRGLSLNIMGAFARNVGRFDIMKYFNKTGVL